jgi:hypothetical protein
LVIWANGHKMTSVGKVLATGPVVFIGLISYSLYLWHWPVFVFSKYWAIGQIPLSQRLLLLLTSMILAVLSWKFVETPFRKRLAFNSRTAIFTFASITSVALLLSGLAIHEMQGVPSRIPAVVLQYAGGRTDRAFVPEFGLNEAMNGEFIELGMGDKRQPIEILIWGDSHAMAVMPVLDVLCREHAIRGVGAMHSGTAPLVGYESQSTFGLREDCIAFNDAVVEFIRNKRVNNVILVASWSLYQTYGGTGGLRRGLLETISALKGSGVRIWIMKSVPQHRWNVPRALAYTVFFGGDPEELGLPLADHREVCRREDQIFEGVSTPSIVVLDPTDLYVSPTDLCRVAEGGKALYWDDNHLTTHGAMVLRPLFEPIFEGIRRQAPVARKTSK